MITKPKSGHCYLTSGIEAFYLSNTECDAKEGEKWTHSVYPENYCPGVEGRNGACCPESCRKCDNDDDCHIDTPLLGQVCCASVVADKQKDVHCSNNPPPCVNERLNVE